MLPYLNLFGRAVPMYGLMAMLGVLVALCYLKWTQPGHAALDADIELTFIWGMLGAFLGAKLLYLLTVFPDLLRDFHLLATRPTQFLTQYILGGFVFYGGLLGALLAGYLYCRVSRVSFWPILGRVLPVLPLIHGFGRIGCFFTGCCYGRPAQHESLGIAFSVSSVAPNGVALLPVQLYEAAGVFTLAALLIALRRKMPAELLLSFYLFFYGLLRFVLEFFRGDSYRGFIWKLSVSQVISLLVIAGACGLLVLYQRQVAKMRGTSNA